MIVYTLRWSTTIKTFSSRDARPRFYEGLYRLDAQLLAAARTQCVHYQQDQIRMTYLLYAEWPANMKQTRAYVKNRNV